MSLSIGLYAAGDSWLHRLDPRPKLWLATAAIITALSLHDLRWQAAMLLGVHLILLSGQVSLRRLGTIWRQLAPLLAMILILQPWFAPGDAAALWTLGPLRLTWAGMLSGATFAARAAAVAFAALVPVLTTPLERLVQGLHRVGLPYTWSLTIGLALRYLVTLESVYAVITQAQQARGWTTQDIGLFRRLRALLPSLVALIVASLRLSDTLALGLAARGLGAPHRRTTLHPLRLAPLDWLALIAVTILFAGMLAARFVLR